MSGRIRLVLFDLGGVACRFRPARRLAALAAATGLAEGEIRARVWDSGLDAEMDRGRYGLADACRAVADALGRALAPDALLQAWARAFEPDPEVLALVGAARRARRVALLTDNGPILLAAVPRHLPALASGFDSLLFSCELGAVKPLPECFAAALRRADVRPEEALLIDDAPANVAGARAYGLRASLFSGVAPLGRELAQLD